MKKCFSLGKHAAAALAALLLALGASGCSEVRQETPAPAETAAVAEAAPEPTQQPASTVCISEVMSHNQALLADEQGHFHDWIELYNAGEEAVDLTLWRLSDKNGSGGWRFPALSIGPGEYLLVYADGKTGCTQPLCADFSLSDGESVFLYDGQDRLVSTLACLAQEDNCSAALIEGEARVCGYPTPGYANTDEGYGAWQETLAPRGPLLISEVTAAVANENDWVEICNVSDAFVRLSDYTLSDSAKDLQKWRFPDRVLGPGEREVFLCEEGSDSAERISFSLKASGEQLFLSSSSELVDWLPVRGLPLGGSVGRMEGEPGYFYFSAPSKGKANTGGARMISVPPHAETEEGVYHDVESLRVILAGEGELYYTTDSKYPTPASARYSEPLELTETTVVRAVAVQEGKLPSAPITLSFILNEADTLPVLSLVGYEPAAFRAMYSSMNKDREEACHLAYFDGETSFSLDCGASLSGNKSLNLLKKSLNIHFRSRYGADTLECDLFGGGITSFSSLTIRAGQDYQYLFFRNEYWQDLCMEASDRVPAQRSKYCALYLNGKYHGIFALKENLSRALFAAQMGVAEENVESLRLPCLRSDSFYKEVVSFCQLGDMSDPAQYAQLCERIDIDNFVDYFLIEGFSGNNDLDSNVRLFRSAADGIKWQLAFFDLDLAFDDTEYIFYNILGSESNEQLRVIYRELRKNPDFRERLIRRYAELRGTLFCNETLLERIDRYVALLEQDMPRDRERWNLSMEDWRRDIEQCRLLIEKGDWEATALANLCQLLKIEGEEYERWFGS